MPEWGGPNLLRFCGNPLRSITIQTGVGGEEKRELATVESLKDKWLALGMTLSHNSLDDPSHPLLEQLWDWHLHGTAPRPISPSGKIALYMPFSIGNSMTRVAALDVDLFRSKNGEVPDTRARQEYLNRTHAIHAREGVPFLWAFSRSFGIHHWYFFDRHVSCGQALNFVLRMRQLHLNEGLYPLSSGERIDDKVDPRPKTANAHAITESHRLLIPYSQWYPHTKFFNVPDPNSPVPHDFAPVPINIGEAEVLKTETDDGEIRQFLDIPHISYSAPPTWRKIGTDQHEANLKKLDSFESNVNLAGLIPCATSILANRREIPDGQWHNFSFLLAQSVAALNSEDKETALDQLTEILNLIGSFGGYPPDSYEAFNTTINSAYKAMDKGQTLACRRVGIAKDNCCSVICNLVAGGYKAVQKVPVVKQPRVYKRVYTDPLAIKVKGNRYISLCIPAYLKMEYQNPDQGDPQENAAVFFEFDSREALKYERFAAAVQSLGMKNIEKYDVDQLLAALPKKQFSYWMNDIIIKHALAVPDDTPLYRSDFLRLLSKAIGRKHLTPLNHEVKHDHPLRIWLDDSKNRQMAILRTTMNGIATELIRRAGAIDSGKVIEHYMDTVLHGSKIIKCGTFEYVDLNFAENAQHILLDSGSANVLDRSYDRLAEEETNVSMMSMHRKRT